MGYSIISALILALDLVAIVSLLMGRGSAMHKVFWIVSILVLPLLGMILYFLFGRSRVDA